MAREIKFRAWDEKQKKMLYGVSIGTIKVWDENVPLISHEFSYSEDCIFEQYTGLKDKNGKEIYEGDIVNITAIVETDDSDMACIMDTNSAVCWDKEHARWDVNDKPESKDWDYRRRRYFVFVDSNNRKNVEVIGNIHVNGDLLK